MIPVAAVSYGICALAFLGAALMVVLRRPLRAQWQLAGCCFVTALWAGVSACYPGPHLPPAAEAMEMLRAAAWLGYLLQIFGARRKWWAMLPVVAALVPLGAPLSFIRLVLAVLGMLLVERLYRDSASGARWGVKFICIGVGALFAFDFYLYSDALLLARPSNELWAARGLVNALSAPLVGVAALRSATAAPALMLSRRLLLGSIALLGSAIYLLAMASVAWYVRLMGGAWGPAMQLLCLGGAILLLVVVLFSGTARASVKVFINKHFFRSQFDYRDEWMRLTRALSSESPDLPMTAMRALAALVESPAGVLWTRGESGSFLPAASLNMAPPPIIGPMGNDWCRFMAARQWVIDVAEYNDHPQRYAGLALPQWLCELPNAWLLVPLMLHGQMYGVACLAEPRSRLLLNWELIDLLKIAASQAASYLAFRQSSDSLSVARQFEAINQMSAFVVHDLKNLISQLSLLLMNAERHQADPGFQADMLETVAHSLGKMKQLLLRLRQQGVDDFSLPMPLDQVLERAVGRLSSLRPSPLLAVSGGDMMVRASAQRLERVLGHIIQNGIEATSPDGRVEVRLVRQTDTALLTVSDTGAGMSEQFIRDRLFKPFASTKADGMGIGMFESRAYIQELGGQLEVRSAPGQGTTFLIRLPLYENEGHG
jgi:putative PEP-CTERM system histidine kinase